MKPKIFVSIVGAMIFVGVLAGLAMGYTTGSIPGFSDGIPFSGYDTSAQMSDEVSAFVTKSDNSQGKSISISLVDDAGTNEKP